MQHGQFCTCKCCKYLRSTCYVHLQLNSTAIVTENMPPLSPPLPNSEFKTDSKILEILLFIFSWYYILYLITVLKIKMMQITVVCVHVGCRQIVSLPKMIENWPVRKVERCCPLDNDVRIKDGSTQQLLMCRFSISFSADKTLLGIHLGFLNRDG